MDAGRVIEILNSIEGFGGMVGIMGGEPTLHRFFPNICEVLKNTVPKKRRGLWTSGYNWEKYKDVILDTFPIEHIVYNEHSTQGGIHQPLLVVMRDIVKDKKLRAELKDNCWAQRRWETCSVTPQGAYFCEIAGALDILFNEGKNAVPIEPGWWKNTELFKKQQEICDSCGAPIPIGGMSDRATFDLISQGNLKKLKKLGSPKVLSGNYALYNRKWDKEQIINKSQDWKPWNFRDFHANNPLDYAGHR
jgi:predicted glycosyl hydrolase (DUF1957 family)